MFGRRVFNTYLHASFECFCTLVFSIDAPRRRQPVCLFLPLSTMLCQMLVLSDPKPQGHPPQSRLYLFARTVCWVPDSGHGFDQ